MAATDPFALLKADHNKVSKLFAEILDTTERAEKTRGELFAELRDALEEHAELEEAVLYPKLEEVDATHEMALEAEQEHKVVKELLGELEAGDPTSEEWTAQLKVLKENVEHHVKEEESKLFPETIDTLGEEEVTKLEEELVTTKQEIN